ncbi:MAG: Saccharopine dehydrogenase [NADP(+), L-glutamate-forming] [Bogoriella megaspora]|nr:MAG: Saccharopine dehydrogenase [NADP(+), L-glutamate-forming] [Bogoriella megaspora]
MAPARVLLLGSGFVAKPTVVELSKSGIEVTIACRHLDNAKKLAEGINLTKAISLDVTDDNALDAAVAQHDLVISLIPYTFHAAVIKSAIRNKKNVVTTSYVSPAMLELEDQVKDTGITVMNEIGLDPGIDHLYAVSMIESVHKAGGKIKSFYSYCGGLPSPEDSGNPLGYKFSWSSRGVLLALRNAATFYEGGKVVNVAGPGFAFVAYPNRDSTPYKERYNIPEAETIIRGTLRYQGFPEFVKVLVDIGFLSDENQGFLDAPIAWKEATQKTLSATSPSKNDLLSAISSKTTFRNNDEKKRVVAGLKWLGIFSDSKITPKGNPLDTLCATLEEKMQYEKGERDLVLLQHKFEIENKDGSRETRTSTLCEYGAPTGSGDYSAMARLVGIPCAVGKSSSVCYFPIFKIGFKNGSAAPRSQFDPFESHNRVPIPVKQVLNGTISEKGILAPMKSEINEPLIKELKEQYG